jgi:hypothetical protein
MRRTDMTEYDIVLQLCAPPTVDRDLLESHMYEVLDVVEKHASDTALGPVVAVNFEGRQIDLGFNVEASSLEAAQSRVNDVLRVIEMHSEVAFTPTATSASLVADGADHLCVA